MSTPFGFDDLQLQSTAQLLLQTDISASFVVSVNVGSIPRHLLRGVDRTITLLVGSLVVNGNAVEQGDTIRVPHDMTLQLAASRVSTVLYTEHYVTEGREIVIHNESASGLSVHYFTAPWCQPCQDIKPSVQAFASSRPHVTLITVDVSTDLNDSLTTQFNVKALPTFVVTEAETGLELGRFEGADLRKLTELVDSAQDAAA